MLFLRYCTREPAHLSITPLAQEDFDKNDYPVVDSEYMNAALNKGEHGRIKGTVINDVELSSANALEVKNKEGTFVIYYNPRKFAAEFEIGKEYTFYGDIAAAKKWICRMPASRLF